MKCEELHGKKFETDEQLRTTISNYICFDNDRRLHSSLGYLPQAVYESRTQGTPSVK